MTKIFVSKKKMSDTKSRIWKIPNLLTDADRSTDTKRNLFGDVWMDVRKYGHTKRGEGEVKCNAHALKLCMKLWMYFTENVLILTNL